MDENLYDGLKLQNQLCFPLYACAKEIVRRYKPYLEALDLTYTQYIAMMVLWEEKKINVKKLGEKLFLDSGTLTPVLKKLEAKGFINRERDKNDERSLNITITDKGAELQEKAASVPAQVGTCINLTPDKANDLHQTLYEILESIN